MLEEEDGSYEGNEIEDRENRMAISSSKEHIIETVKEYKKYEEIRIETVE